MIAFMRCCRNDGSTAHPTRNPVAAKHLLIASCADAVVPASVRYIPATQSVQIGADALDHFPAAQVEHAIVEADEAFPASQAVHDAPPALAKVSVVEPAAQTRHLPMAS